MVEVDEHDIESEYARIAMRAGMKSKDVRKAYEKNDAVFDLVAQLRKSKALDWLLHHLEIVDEAGQAISAVTDASGSFGFAKAPAGGAVDYCAAIPLRP